MRILLHLCCAHCLAWTVQGLCRLYGKTLELGGLWYNPNIHPLLEYRRRLKAVHVYQERDPLPIEFVDSYGLIPFLDAIGSQREGRERCRLCYRLRLDYVANRAAEQHYDAFTTTMIVSTHQDHTLLREIGEAIALSRGIPFLYHDLREERVPDRMIRGLYRQTYCGCIFSEAERFASTTRFLYKTPERFREESATRE